MLDGGFMRRHSSFSHLVRSSLLVTLAGSALACCMGPTPYAPAVDGLGYANAPIEANRYRVSFAGNSRTTLDTVETYLLYRAAEVTLSSGRDWFRVADRDTAADTSYRAYSAGLGSWRPFFYGPGFAPGFVDATTTIRPITRYGAYANILVFTGEKPVGDPHAYDARSVLETLGPRIVRPEAATASG
jgi:hypothetical protein